MLKFNWKIVLGIVLLFLSALCYFVHYLLFKDSHHIFVYLVGDVAFVFVEVLLVTLIIHNLLEIREKKSRLNKMNMVIGAFFSEVGVKLLRQLSNYDPLSEKMHEAVSNEEDSAEDKFKNIREFLRSYEYEVAKEKIDLETLKDFLLSKRGFMLRLLENPILLEHEAFSSMLWAVFHLAEELEARDKIGELPESDHKHLVNDTKRVYGQLTVQWLNYMRHLRKSYPFLFSLSVRQNPFDKNANPVITE